MYRLKHTLQHSKSHLTQVIGARVALLNFSTQMEHSDMVSRLAVLSKMVEYIYTISIQFCIFILLQARYLYLWSKKCMHLCWRYMHLCWATFFVTHARIFDCLQIRSIVNSWKHSIGLFRDGLDDGTSVVINFFRF